MRNPEFYEISAQVIPAIFIAVLLELKNLVGRTAVRWEKAFETAVKQEEVRRFRHYRAAAILMFMSAGGFVAGELSALSVVLLGTSGRWPTIAVVIVSSGLVLLTFVAVVAPLLLDEAQAVDGVRYRE